MSHLRTVIAWPRLLIEPLPHRRGVSLDDEDAPLVCTCPHPQPEPVRLFDHIIVAGAYECRRCRRPTHVSRQVR